MLPVRPLLLRYAALGLALVAAMALWWTLGAWDVARARAADAAEASVALTQVADRVDEAFAEMETWGRTVSALPALQDGLEGDAGPLVEALAAFDLAPHLAVEVYTPAPELVAWNGFAMPLGEPVGSVRFLRDAQTALVRDGEERSALVLWLPVRGGGRLVGAVRVVRLVQQRVPVQNRYLRPYDAAVAWGGRIEWRADGNAARMDSTHLQGESVTTPVWITGPDGTVVGRVLAGRNGPNAAVAAAERRRNGVRAFWAVLLLGWAVAGAVGGLRRLERAARAGVPGGWRRWAVAASGAAALWIGLRYGLVWLDVPARWAPTGAATPDWFSPRVLASGLGGGLVRSVADLALTAAFAVATGAVALRAALLYRRSRSDDASSRARGSLGGGLGGGLVVGVVLGGIGMGLAWGFAVLVRAAVFDATLPYFEQGGSMVQPLVLAVFASLLGAALAGAMLVGAGWAVVGHRSRAALVPGLGVLAGAGAVFALPAVHAVLPTITAFGLVAVGVLGAHGLRASPQHWAAFVTLRGLVIGVLVLAAVTYPTLYRATAALQAERMVEGAEPFADGRDARVVFALEQVLRDARADASLRTALSAPPPTSPAPIPLAPSPRSTRSPPTS